MNLDATSAGRETRQTLESTDKNADTLNEETERRQVSEDLFGKMRRNKATFRFTETPNPGGCNRFPRVVFVSFP